MDLFTRARKPITLRPYQQEAVHAVYGHLRVRDDNPVVVLPTACHAEDHPILMYDGTVKPVQDVRVGDLLMGPDSKPRKVLALCRGEDELYKIIPLKGEHFVVNGDHVLSLQCTNEGKRRFPCYRRGGEIDNVTVRDYLSRSNSWRHLRKLYRVAVDFPQQRDLPIPPYILGALIGDGTLRGTVELTNVDHEIVDAWCRYVELLGCEVIVREDGGRCPSYRIKRTTGKFNMVNVALESLGLAGAKSGFKFIPQEYLTASTHDRLELLAGLIDTDGSRHRTDFDFITKSRELAADVVYLARSLGLAAHCREKYCACQTGAGGWFFRICISGDTHRVPCRLPRKRAPERKQKKSVLRVGFRIEPFGRGAYCGFVLDGDHLYVDGHFFVHHNSGKTPVLSTICQDAVALWDGRVLVLAHVKELLEQTAGTLTEMAPDLDVGVYSAGLNRREIEHKVIVAGIQSVYKKACDLDRFDLVLVDEAHLIPPDGEGMYRTFLADAKVINPQLRVVGLTATPFRMTSGPICRPDHFLNHICYEIGVRELIVQGYLCPLRTKASRRKVDTSNLHVRGGEFVSNEVEALMDQEDLVRAACREIVELTPDRHTVLIFASGIQHGFHVQRTLSELGQECGFVSGETLPFERADTLRRFREGRLKYLCNVNVLTTGFDAPNIDCVVLLRPTMSPGLYYQSVGRGFRLHPSKTDCLVLDFGGNVLRHGPVDDLRIDDRKSGNGQAPAKECPQCQAVIHAAYSICPDCGHEFPPPDRQRHDREATTAGILSGQIEDTEYAVDEVFYSVHTKRDAKDGDPRSLRVEYRVGFNHYVSEWVCVEHSGYPRAKAEQWWRQRSKEPVPETAEDAMAICQAGGICQTKAITVRRVTGEKYDRIIRHELGPKPPRLDGSEEREADDLPAYAGAEFENVPF